METSSYMTIMCPGIPVSNLISHLISIKNKKRNLTGKFTLFFSKGHSISSMSPHSFACSALNHVVFRSISSHSSLLRLL